MVRADHELAADLSHVTLSYLIMSEGDFDVIVLGTGLTESILAAALSKHGLKTAQLDLNPYYGAEQASLSVQEFITWAQSNPPGYSDFALSTTEPISQGRQYALSLHPSVIPSTGPLISSLIGSGVSRYGGFRLLENVAVHHQDKISLVPGSKEAIFKSKSIPLIDKRRLMRFLSFVAGTDDLPAAKELQGDQQHLPLPEFLDKAFNLKDKGLVNTITYALTYSARPSDPVLPALERLRQYLRSAGRYGTSPFLIAHYGSSGEIAQGFCRAAAVAGGVYILGREIISIEEQSMELGLRYKITMSDFPEPLTCKLLVSSLSFIPKLPLTPAVSAQSSRTAVARCIAIIDTPLYLDSPPPEASDTTDDGEATTQPPERSPMDAAVIVFPPSSESESAVTVLVVGEGTMSTPKERCKSSLPIALTC